MTAVASSMPQRTELVFIESNVPDYATLIAGLSPAQEVHVLDAAGDGLAQMAKILSGRNGVDAIHLISHGSTGAVQLGTVTLDEETLENRRSELETIGQSLGEDGDLLLYGCNVAQEQTGINFIGKLAQATGADVAASTDLTGAAAKGGDWVLEKDTGQIDARAMLNDSGLAGFSGLLATVTFVEESAEDLNIESGATSFARTIDGANFTFANGSSAYAGSYFDIQTMNGIPGDGFAGVYALSARNAGGGVDFTIAVQNGYTFDLTGFAASASTGLIRVYYNGMASYKDFNLGSIDTEKNLSSLTDFNDVTSVTFSSENYALFQGLIITDVKAPPTLSTPSTIIYTDTAAANTFSNQTGTLTASASAVTNSPIASFGIFGGTSGGSTDISGTLYDVSQAGTYGTLYVKSSDGSYVYVPNATAINATSSAQSETFTVTATDNAAATSTATLMVNITGANDTPAITSGATATVAENSTGTVYTATASDADAGQTLSYSLGGTDASLFNINSSTGAVSFKVAPNYEVPSDSGSDNVYDITVTATDSGAGALNASRAVAITVTNAVEFPSTTVVSAALSADTGSSLTDFTTNTASQTISGTLTANLASGEKVEVSYDNGGSWSDATSYTVGSNSWSTTTTLSGSNTFQARVSNADGSGTAYTHGYTLDTTAPTTTVSTAGFSADTGSSNTDLITKTAAQTVSGTLSANLVSGESVYVSLDNGSTWTAATATAGSSAWSLTGQTLTASSTLRVKVQDEAGNDGVVYSQAYVFDTTAPTTTVATASFSADTGSSSTDFNTSTAAQTISGTLSANLANGETVYVSLDNGSAWTAATASVGSNAWSLAGQTLTASSTLKIKVNDAAGNDGSVFSQAYLLDTTAPTITFGTIRFSADTGSSNSDLVTSTAAQTITATLSVAPAGADVVYGSLDNGSTWTDITTKVSGTTLSWNGVTLTGSDTLLLRVVDAAGNVGASTSQAYTLDTTAPPAPGTPVLDSASDTGISNSDRITSDTTPTLTGSADNGTTVSVYDGATLLGTTVAGASGWSFTSGVLGSGSHTMTAVATDAAGNASAASSPLSMTIDSTAPATSSVTVPASGTYYVGNALDFTVNFNEAIVVNTSGGTPRIAMVVGATTRYADYIAGSGTSGLVFRYVVPSGDTDSNGITLGALDAHGGSFKDAAGNDAVITLNSVGSTASINVDGSQPSVTGVSASSADGAYREGQTITLTVGFSSAVTVDTTGGTPTLALGSGGSATYVGGSGSTTLSFSYVIGAGQNSADLDYTSTAALALNGATIIETGGSHQTASLALATPGTAGSLGANNNIVIDTVRPTATVVMADNALTIGETSAVTVIFSEAVSGFDNADLTITNGSLSAVSSTDGGVTWTTTFTPAAGVTDATNAITLNNTGVTDTAGNAGSGITSSDNYTVNTIRSLSYSTTTFTEAAADNGSITTSCTITLTNDTFTGAIGAVLGAVGNVPNGLTAVLTKASATTATLSFTGNAVAHANANDIANLTVTFGNSDFAGGSSAAVTGATTTDLVIDFANPVVPPPPPSTGGTTTAVVDGVTVNTGTKTAADGSQVSVVSVNPVIVTRSEDSNTPNTQLADIPLVTDASGTPTLQIGLPVGIGVESSSNNNDAALALRQQLINASDSLVIDTTAFTQIVSDGIDRYVSTVSDQSQVTVRTLTLDVITGGSAPSQPIVITGAMGTGESDAAHPLRQEALVIDARNLPARAVLELNQVEFAIIVGAATVTGGIGRNYVIGDASDQTIILGAEDDILHGGAGNDTVGSRGGNDQLYGDVGNDLLVGGVGSDILTGGSGDDTLQGGQSDAGTWAFKLNAKHQLITTFTADDSRLAENASETITGAWRQSTAALTANTQVSFADQDIGKLETITLLYQALIQQKPDLAGMNYWANQNYSEQQLADLAYSNHIANRSFDTLEAQANDLITWLWGAPAATDALIKVVTDYISAGGDGNDTLIGGRGSNTLDGGNGIDTAKYSGTLSAYLLAQGEGSSGNPFSVVARNGNGKDSLTHIERLQFADTKIALDLDATGHAGKTMEFIGTIAPSLLGNTAVRGQILALFDAGETMQALCQRAIDLHLVPTANTDLATTIYQNVMAEAPTADMTQALTSYIDVHGQANFLATVAGMALNIDLVGLRLTGVEYA